MKPTDMAPAPVPTVQYWQRLTGIFILLVLGAHYAGENIWPTEPLQRRWLGIGLLVATGVAVASMAMALRALHQRPGAFVQGVLGGTLLRLLAGVLGTVGVALVAKTYLVAFVGGFFAGYFVFTGFEVWTMLHILRRLSKTPPAAEK